MPDSKQFFTSKTIDWALASMVLAALAPFFPDYAEAFSAGIAVCGVFIARERMVSPSSSPIHLPKIVPSLMLFLLLFLGFSATAETRAVKPGAWLSFGPMTDTYEASECWTDKRFMGTGMADFMVMHTQELEGARWNFTFGPGVLGYEVDIICRARYTIVEDVGE